MTVENYDAKIRIYVYNNDGFSMNQLIMILSTISYFSELT